MVSDRLLYNHIIFFCIPFVMWAFVVVVVLFFLTFTWRFFSSMRVATNMWSLLTVVCKREHNEWVMTVFIVFFHTFFTLHLHHIYTTWSNTKGNNCFREKVFVVCGSTYVEFRHILLDFVHRLDCKMVNVVKGHDAVSLGWPMPTICG